MYYNLIYIGFFVRTLAPEKMIRKGVSTMMKSMTAFGRFEEVTEAREITVEIRSVNNRFLDCNIRLPRRYDVGEDRIKSYLKECGICRGKVDLSIAVSEKDTSPASVVLDEEYLKGYLDALYTLRDTYGLKDDISVMTVARNAQILKAPEPVETESAEEPDYFEILKPAIDGALKAFLEGRTREGARLERDLREKLAGVEQMVGEIKAHESEVVTAYRARLEERLRTVLRSEGVKADETRILTECAIFADRVAIDEELVRLNSHFRTFEEIASADEPAGRKLDFLLQEINREVNTIGSKCSDAGIAKIVVNIKTELEKIREQVQNLE